ncbi:GDP-L-galactose phosphorylase 2 [Diplonema papillatum]|nr:GDP-L-galactose phosphorylase 2 [Diplonema papillatum]
MDEEILEKWRGKADDPSVTRSAFSAWRGKRVGGHLRLWAKYSGDHWKAKRGGCHAPAWVDVVGPFDAAAFNFNQIAPAEVLFPVAADGRIAPPGGECASEPAALLIVNASPMFLGHSLLVPARSRNFPQVLRADALGLAAAFIARSRRADARLCYNSLGAFASVNHLHFHYLCLAESQQFAVELAAKQHRRTFLVHPHAASIVTLGTIPGYPVHCLYVLHADEVSDSESWDAVHRFLFRLFEVLHSRRVPYNLVLTPGRFMYVCPRRNQACNVGEYRMAVVEVFGCPVLQTEEAYEGVSEAAYERCARSDIRLPDAEFESLLVDIETRWSED